MVSPNPTDRGDTDRGQAYTLEGFIGAIIVLTAVLFALQSLVLTANTGGNVERAAQTQIQQEIEDALIVAENDGQLSHLVRYWNATDEEYHNGTVIDGRNGYYPASPNRTKSFGDEFVFGELLEGRFLNESGRTYNVQVHYWNETADERDSFYLVYQGSGTPNAQSASHTIPLYDDQRLTAPEHDGTTLAEADDETEYRIPDAVDGPVYNVVEIRVVVW